MRKLGYFTEWSVYRDNSKSLKELVVDGHYTDIIYAFAVFDESCQLSFGDPYAAIDKGILQDLLDLKILATISTVGISVGGWNNRADFELLDCQRLEDTIVQFVVEQNFDLVDIDWEFDSLDDAQRLQGKLKNLICGLRSKLPSRIDIMVSLPCNMQILQALPLSEISSYVDIVNVMGYDLSGAWSPTAELYSSLATIATVIEALSKAMPNGKLCIGVSGFGALFQGCARIGCQFDHCSLITAKDIHSKKLTWVETEKASVFHLEDCSILSIESKASLDWKLDFVQKRALAGICVWDVEAFSYII